MPNPKPGCADAWSNPNAPVRDADHDLIICRLALALNITKTTWIRRRRRPRHGLLVLRLGSYPASLYQLVFTNGILTGANSY